MTDPAEAEMHGPLPEIDPSMFGEFEAVDEERVVHAALLLYTLTVADVEAGVRRTGTLEYDYRFAVDRKEAATEHSGSLMFAAAMDGLAPRADGRPWSDAMFDMVSDPEQRAPLEQMINMFTAE